MKQQDRDRIARGEQIGVGRRMAILGGLVLLCAGTVLRGESKPLYDLSSEKVLYCVGYAHLDTQWRWDFCTTIDKYIRDTLDQNFERIEQFPEYVFNFTGSVRYEMMKEYYPEKYARLKQYIADGRWFVSGSSVDEGDVNVPSAEAIIRQVLYGNEYFRREFGRESLDYMLPDCFGFPASMPSIWAHCGLKGFSTQKLTWGSAVGIPFPIGLWEGPDGRSVIAAFDPGPYVGAIQGRVDLNPQWVQRVHENGRKYGVWADYHYYGVGDQGGAPREEDVRNYIASVDNSDSLIRVALVSSDQMFKDITPEQRARLPRYKGDLLLTEHSAGTLTSQSYMKRWNRKNEILADAAERAAVAASWLGGASYPREKLNRSWVRLLANQMHDILPGTSIPRAYTYSWNDEIVAMNGFAAVLHDSTGAVTRALNTQGQGVPLVIYNPLAIERADSVEATVQLEPPLPSNVAVIGPDGEICPSQILSRSADTIRILFLARVPPVSWSVFDVRPLIRDPAPVDSELRVSQNELENEHYRVHIDDNGDVAGIVDKQAGSRELLAGPARLVFTHERPRNWPAWNMDWVDRQRPPVDVLSGPAKARVVERGPVRVAVEVERAGRDSAIVQRICLTRGDAGRRIEFHTEIDWQSVECALKASFPLNVKNPKATYNWGLGTIDRGNNEPTQYEVPSHEWFDLTEPTSGYGVSVLEDSKFGSDKPADHEVRLTLLYTPGVRSGYLDQHSQDWGRHEMIYALYGHSGDWRDGRSEWQARRLNQPLRAWQVPPHPGDLGRRFSFVKVSTDQVDIRAIKLAENSKRIVIRLQELWGRDARNVEIAFARPVREAEEVDGQERRIGSAALHDGRLLVNLTPYSPASYALVLEDAPVSLEPAHGQPLQMTYDVDVVSSDGDRADGGMDAEGRTFPAEVLPRSLASEGVEFRLGDSSEGRLNAVCCRGQTLEFPQGDFDRVYLLAAGQDDVTATFTVGERSQELSVQNWTGFIGQWDDRIWDREFGEVDYRCEGQVTGISPGYIKRDTIAWFATHRHHPQRGNEAYKFSYLFKYGLDLRPGDRTLRLPDDPRIKLFAVTLADSKNDAVRLAAPLYDDFTDRKPIVLRHVYPPPPTPVFEGVSTIGRVVTERGLRFEDLSFGPPSKQDDVDQSSGQGLVFRYLDGDGQYRPHPGSGLSGETLPRLNDGDAAQNDDDTQRCVWYDSEGRFHIDLQRSIGIGSIRTYSWHRSDRAPQFFSVWGANSANLPDPGFAHGQHGDWKLLGVVNSKELGEGGVHGSLIKPTQGQPSMGPFRYLLWIAENVGSGTFFTEIDVDVAE